MAGNQHADSGHTFLSIPGCGPEPLQLTRPDSGVSCSQLRKRYPDYSISKNKIELPPGADADDLLESFKKEYAAYEVNTSDGVKVDMPEGWVHLRKSNTEPIIRLYAEARTEEEAGRLAAEASKVIQKNQS